MGYGDASYGVRGYGESTASTAVAVTNVSLTGVTLAITLTVPAGTVASTAIAVSGPTFASTTTVPGGAFRADIALTGVTFTSTIMFPPGDPEVGPSFDAPSFAFGLTVNTGDITITVPGVVEGETIAFFLALNDGSVGIDYALPLMAGYLTTGVCTDGHHYQVFALDMKSRLIKAELDWANSSLNYERVIGDHGSCNLVVDSDAVKPEHLTASTAIVVTRDGVNVWQGPLMSLSRSGNSNMLSLSAVGVTQFLERRFLQSNLPVQSMSLQDVVGGYLAMAQQGVGGDFGLSLRYTGDQSAVYTDFISATDEHTFRSLIDELGNQKLGYDWYLNFDDAFNSYLEVYAPRFYRPKASVVFDWGKSITSYEWSKDFHSMANWVKVHGGGQPSAQDIELSRTAVYLDTTVEDVGSQLDTFRFETSQQYTTVTDKATLQQLGTRLLQRRSRPYNKLGTVSVEGCIDAPHFGTYGPGDVVGVQIDDGFVQVNGAYRITRMQVTPDVGKNERVDLTFEDASTAVV